VPNILFYLVPFLVLSHWDILLAGKEKAFFLKKLCEKLLPDKQLRDLLLFRKP